jgi:hypothetical protein
VVGTGPGSCASDTSDLVPRVLGSSNTVDSFGFLVIATWFADLFFAILFPFA